MDTPVNKRPKVTKRELKKTQKGARKSKKNTIKKKQKKPSANKPKLK